MRVIALLMVAITTVWSCARAARTPEQLDARTVLQVDNQAFADMNVFALPQGGTRIRLGTVTGKTTAYLTLPRSLVPGGMQPLRFIAAPIATRRGEVSEEILVTPGDTVVLLIPPV